VDKAFSAKEDMRDSLQNALDFLDNSTYDSNRPQMMKGLSQVYLLSHGIFNDAHLPSLFEKQ
jgi:hypothetical protein